MTFSPIEKDLAKASGGTLLDAKTYADKIVIVLVDGRKLSFTREQAEGLLNDQEEKAKAKAKAEKATAKAEKAEK